jgi:uncharacterized lipoprotein YajG
LNFVDPARIRLMRTSRFLVAIAAALLLAACARHQTAYVIDPATGQPVVSQQYAQSSAPQYAQTSAPQYAQAYAQQPTPAPQPQPQP